VGDPSVKMKNKLVSSLSVITNKKRFMLIMVEYCIMNQGSQFPILVHAANILSIIF